MISVKDSLRPLLIRVATLALFVGMIGGLVLYRCKTAKPKEDLPAVFPEGTVWLYPILNRLNNERFPSSKIGPIFRPNRHDTLTAYEVLKMRRALKTASGPEVVRYNAHYQRVRSFPSERGPMMGDIFGSRHPEAHHLLSDSATAWLLYRYQPGQLSIGRDKVSRRFQQLLKERQKEKKKDRASAIGRSDTAVVAYHAQARQYSDTVAVLRHWRLYLA